MFPEDVFCLGEGIERAGKIAGVGIDLRQAKLSAKLCYILLAGYMEGHPFYPGRVGSFSLRPA
ncbi:hypothetical protein FQZ97_1103620 [compost metagenome]